jgi:hypothetical protein
MMTLMGVAIGIVETVVQVIAVEVRAGTTDWILQVQGVVGAGLESIRGGKGSTERIAVADAGMVAATVVRSKDRNRTTRAAGVGATDEGEREYESGQNK